MNKQTDKRFKLIGNELGIFHVNGVDKALHLNSLESMSIINVKHLQKLALLDVEYRGDLMALLCDAFPQKRIIFHLVNVRERNSLERAFTEVMSKFQAIHCVVACAGVLNEPDYQLTVDVNLVTLNSKRNCVYSPESCYFV